MANSGKNWPSKNPRIEKYLIIRRTFSEDMGNRKTEVGTIAENFIQKDIAATSTVKASLSLWYKRKKSQG